MFDNRDADIDDDADDCLFIEARLRFFDIGNEYFFRKIRPWLFHLHFKSICFKWFKWVSTVNTSYKVIIQVIICLVRKVLVFSAWHSNCTFFEIEITLRHKKNASSSVIQLTSRIKSWQGNYLLPLRNNNAVMVTMCLGPVFILPWHAVIISEVLSLRFTFLNPVIPARGTLSSHSRVFMVVVTGDTVDPESPHISCDQP